MSHQPGTASNKNSLLPDTPLEKLGLTPTVLTTAPTHHFDHYIAAINWLKKYQPPPTAPNLEQVRGYLEAFYHLCAIENWQTAKQLLLVELNTSSQEELDNQFQTWGYYPEQAQLYRSLLGKLDERWNAICLNGLGNIANLQGQHQTALTYHQQQLDIARKLGDRAVEARALGNLGITHFHLGQYQTAIDCYQQQLAIAKAIENPQMSINANSNLGIVYQRQGHYQQALQHFQQQLETVEQLGDRARMGKLLTNLGNLYYAQGHLSRAQQCYQAALQIAQELGDRPASGRAQGNLGNVCAMQGNFTAAIQHHQQDLTIAKELGDRSGELQALGNLGTAYGAAGQYQQAIDCFQAELQLIAQTRSTSSAKPYYNLALIYEKLADLPLALQYCDRSIAESEHLSPAWITQCHKLRDRLVTKATQTGTD